MRYYVSAVAAAMAVVAVSVAGCRERGEVRFHQVPKVRTLAAVVFHEQDAWFFRLTGRTDWVESEVDTFYEFIESLRFEGGSEPSWTLPVHWERGSVELYQELAPTFAPDALIKIRAPQMPLEVTVTRLPRPQSEPRLYLLHNVNRWRDQKGLEPITIDELDEQLRTVSLDETEAFVADLVGRNEATFRSLPRRMTGEAEPPAAADADAPTAPQRAPLIDYERPDDWEDAPPDPFSLLAFQVDREGQELRITVSALAEAAGELLPNVNRWRGQVALEPWSEGELEEGLEAFEVDGAEGHYVELIGAQGVSTLGVLTVTGGRAWFFKLMGDTELALDQRDNFRQFVRSVRFEDSGGAADGY